MASNCPKGFIRLHFRNGKSVLINVNTISFVSDIDGDGRNMNENCHILPIGHNNGGFYVRETFEKVIKEINDSVNS